MIQGDIVLIAFPFTDLKSIKVRPALVISRETFNKHSSDAIFVMITSSVKDIRKEDVLLKQSDSEFAITGLKKESAIRTPRIYCLRQALAKRKLGKVSSSILSQALQRLSSLFFQK